MVERLDRSRRQARRLSPLERLGLGVERMLQPPASPTFEGSRSWIPDIRVVDGRQEVFIRLVSPEIDPRKIRIQLSGRVLTLSAATVDVHPAHHGYHAFKRSIILPKSIDWRKITAKASGQVLTVRIGKRIEIRKEP